MRSHRREILNDLQNAKRPVTSSLFSFDHENKIMLVSYLAKKNKNVIMLSSSHSDKKILPHMDNKPAMIADYNFGKKGVDQMDEEVEEFTCRRKTVRWPFVLFFNMLDIAAFNAFILMKNEGYSASRKCFLKNLCKQLAEKSIRQRFHRNPRLGPHIREAAILLGFIHPSMVSFQLYVYRKANEPIFIQQFSFYIAGRACQPSDQSNWEVSHLLEIFSFTM